MSLKQKKNKHDQTSNHATTTKGSRGNKRLHHGKGKGLKNLMGGKGSKKKR